MCPHFCFDRYGRCLYTWSGLVGEVLLDPLPFLFSTLGPPASPSLEKELIHERKLRWLHQRSDLFQFKGNRVLVRLKARKGKSGKPEEVNQEKNKRRKLLKTY